jgi:hypothetical protein
MIIYYLYIKTHKITGLKYLGQTKQDPFKYKGSGVYWKRHLKKHGNNHNTEILQKCYTKTALTTWGIYYSDLWSVIESKKWANLREESGNGISSSDAKRLAKKLTSNGTHHFQTNNPTKNPNNSTHQRTRERISNGTHHFQTNNPTYQRISNETHNLLGSNNHIHQKTANGTNPFQLPWHCSDCGKSGKNIGMFTRWHSNSKCQT